MRDALQNSRGMRDVAKRKGCGRQGFKPLRNVGCPLFFCVGCGILAEILIGCGMLRKIWMGWEMQDPCVSPVE